MTPEVSVVVPTYNGKLKIEALLTSLEKQTLEPTEVLIVIDGSTDGTEAFLKDYNSSLPISIINQENQGRAAVRNTGAENARGDFLIFYDDDMRPEPDSIQRHVEFHSSYERALCGGNQVEDERKAISDFDQYRCYIRQGWISKYSELTRLTDSEIHLTAANFSIRKNLFKELGGFDSKLRDHEDADLARRAIRCGHSVYFDPSNMAWHDDFISVQAYIKRRREYHQERQNGSKPVQANLFKKGFYSLVATKSFVRRMEKSKLIFLPKAIRYRLYSLVIWGLAVYFPNRSME